MLSQLSQADGPGELPPNPTHGNPGTQPFPSQGCQQATPNKDTASDRHGLRKGRRSHRDVSASPEAAQGMTPTCTAGFMLASVKGWVYKDTLEASKSGHSCLNGCNLPMQQVERVTYFSWASIYIQQQ